MAFSESSIRLQWVHLLIRHYDVDFAEELGPMDIQGGAKMILDKYDPEHEIQMADNVVDTYPRLVEKIKAFYR